MPPRMTSTPGGGGGFRGSHSDALPPFRGRHDSGRVAEPTATRPVTGESSTCTSNVCMQTCMRRV
eukprot:1159260-Pelagomonas_calceolata.AAC.8